MTTINRWNMGRLNEIRQIAMDAGASMWRLQLAKPMGEICGDRDFIVSPRHLLAIIPALAAMKRQGGIQLAVGDSIGYYGPHDRTLRGRGWRGREECWQGCRAGMDAIGIEADGGIKGCLSIQAKAADGSDPWREGSVREHSLAELWFRPGAFEYNRGFTPDQLRGACRTCGQAARCRGGARCVSTAVAGIIGEDPYCWLRVTSIAGNRSFRDYAAQAAAAAGFALIMGGATGCWDDDENGADALEDATAFDMIGLDNQAGDCLLPGDAVTPGDSAADVSGKDVINCENVCCMCDYGIIPEDVWKECCEVQPADPSPDAVADVPVADVQATDVPPDAVACDKVCCVCDYGIIPEDVYQECCVDACKDVCCDCDYGEPPPPQCCP
jgi:hypothetical protein